MIDFDEAVSRIADAAQALGTESVSIDAAHGRRLAAPALAHLDAPATAVSTMDGYAVAPGDHHPGRALRVIGQSRPAHGFDGVVTLGDCVRIFTGAPLPAGAERVVIQEQVTRDGETAAIRAESEERYIRAAGSDFRMGEVLVDPGAQLGPAALTAAAAGDNDRLEVFRRPNIAVLATGDELAPPGQARAVAGAIPDSGSAGVIALAKSFGAVLASRLRLADDRARLQRAAAETLESVDVTVVIGGASVGERDFAKAMFEPLGLELIFSGVRMKPGKPVWFGRARDRLVLGLPGNPGSALVTARLFMAPLLTGLGGGGSRGALNWREEPLAAPLAATGDRETFWRARLAHGGLVPVADQASGAQKALAHADRLIRRRPGEPAARPGMGVLTLEL